MQSPRVLRPHSFLVISLLLLSLPTFPSIIHPAKAASLNNLLYVTPAQQGPFPAGTTFTYQVKVANVTPFNNWDIHVSVNNSVITPVDFTITPNTLTANFSITQLELTHCVNGLGTACDVNDGPGVVHSATFPLGAPPAVSAITGVLFTITYSVVSNLPTSNVEFTTDILGAGTPAPVVHNTQNGIYGAQSLPFIDFNWWTPNLPPPLQGDPVNFTVSWNDPNPGAKTATFTWNFGDMAGGEGKTTSNTTITHVYVTGQLSNGLYFFNVVVKGVDELGASNTRSHRVTIRPRIFHDLSIDSIITSPADSVLPGTLLRITVLVGNHGTFEEPSFSVSASAVGRTLGNKTFDSAQAGGNLTRNQEKSFEFDWDTSGLAAGAYEIDVLVPPLRNATSTQHEVIEANLQNNMLIHIVRIIALFGTSLIPLTLPESLALVIIMLVATGLVRAGIKRSQLKRKRLEQQLA